MSSLCSAVVINSRPAGVDMPPAACCAVPEITPKLIRDLTPILMRYAMRLTRERHAAEDAVQETWIGAISGLANYQGRSSLTTWLLGILRRRACDQRRRVRRTQPIEESDWILRPRLEDQLDARLHVHTVNEVVAALPAREQQALLLCDIRGLDRDEAAELMAISRAHLRVLLCRGRTRIRDAIVRSQGREQQLGLDTNV